MFVALIYALAVALPIALLPACALLAPATARLGEAIHSYCTVPEPARAALRADVNAAAAPHAVRVTCAGDPA